MGGTIYAVVSKVQYGDVTCGVLTQPYIRRMETIADRLARKMNERGLTQYRLWKLSGVSQPTIKRILDGESREPDKSTVERLAKALGTSYLELYDGKISLGPDPDQTNAVPGGFVQLPNEQGPSNSGKPSGPVLGVLEPWDDDTPLEEDEVEVPLFKETEFAVGDGVYAPHIELTNYKVRFARSTLRKAGVDPANAACATASGNSMADYIVDGTTIGIDRGRTQVKDGKIFAIDHGGLLRVKYLYKLPNGGLRLRSHNSDEYPDEVFGADWPQYIKILGWVFWRSSVDTW